MKTSDNTITELPGLSVADIAYYNNSIFTSFYDWGTYSGEVKQLNLETQNSTKVNFNFESVGFSSFSEYHIGAINGSDYLYLTGMGDDVVIFDPSTQEIKHAFKTGTDYVNSVVAVYK